MQVQTSVCDVDLEFELLHRLLFDKHTTLRVMHLLSDACFTDPSHHALFLAMHRVVSEGNEITPLTLNDSLRKVHTAERAQMLMTYLMGKKTRDDESMPDEYLAIRLQEYAKRRAMGGIIQKLMRLYTDMSLPLDEGIAEVQQLFDKTIMSSADSYVTLAQKLDDLLQIVDDNQIPDTLHQGLPCGMSDIDVTGGLPADGLVVVGAKSSHGKTTFATNVAVNALRMGRRIAFYSMEMSQQKVTGRILAMESGVSSNAIQRQRLGQSEYQRVVDAITALKRSIASQFWFDNRSVRDLDTLVMSVRTLKKTVSIDCVVVDYLQLMNESPGRKPENTNKLLGGIAHRLHELAQDLHITIILLSQINRNVTVEPSMSHLRDSGEIAEAADMVIILYNADFDQGKFPKPFEHIDPKGLLLVKVEKNRDGATFSFLVEFDSAATRIAPYDPDKAQPQPEADVLDIFKGQYT